MNRDRLIQAVIRMETLGYEPDAIYAALIKQIDPKQAMEIVRDVTGWGVPLESGRQISDETRAKLSAALKGKKRPLEVRQKIAKTLAGRAPSELVRVRALEVKRQRKSETDQGRK